MIQLNRSFNKWSQTLFCTIYLALIVKSLLALKLSQILAPATFPFHQFGNTKGMESCPVINLHKGIPGWHRKLLASARTLCSDCERNAL